MITEGSLQDFRLPDLLQILAMGSASGTLTLRSEGRVGQLFFRAGQLADAKLGERSGASAAGDLFLWKTGIFDFGPDLPAGVAEGGALDLEAVTAEGHKALERVSAIEKQLPDFFSSRTWVYPMQMFQEAPPALVALLGSGMPFAEWVRRSGLGELGTLEALLELVGADQVGLSCAPEEQLRQLFERVANELFTQFASISGVKMVEGLETQLNDQARDAQLPLRWRGGKVQDALPDTWSKAQLLAAYTPLLATMREFIGKVYGAGFIERVTESLLDESSAPQRALYAELASLPTAST